MAAHSAAKVKAPARGARTVSPRVSRRGTRPPASAVASREPRTTLTSLGSSPARRCSLWTASSTTRRMRNSAQSAITPEVGAARRGAGSKSFQSIDPEAERVLLNYPWPGNIRELENMLDDVRMGRLELTASVLDLLFKAVDLYTHILLFERGEAPDPEQEIAKL